MFWGPLVFAALVVGGLGCETIWRWTSRRDPAIRSIITSIAFAICYTPILICVVETGILGETQTRYTALEIFLLVFAFGLILSAYIVYADLARRSRARPLPKLYSRLPDIGTARIERMTVKDHYVHVFLDDGQVHRLLMRFSDAVNEMDGVPGFCTHRSHWVTQKAAQKALRRGGKEYVVLTCGLEVPVSKTYRNNVVAAGLL